MAVDAIRRVVFTGDCLRTEAGEANQWANVQWLHRLLGQYAHAITGLPVEPALPSPAECWRAMGVQPSVENWSRRFWGEADEALCEYLASSFDGALVIGIELSPLLENALNRLGVPWIEVGVSALRFLPDFALFFRFGPGLSVPHRFRLTSAEIQASVSIVRSYHGTAELSGTVFFAQTRADRTLIGEQGFVSAATFLEQHDGPLWVKPHPLDPDNPVVEQMLSRGGRLLAANTYATLSADVEVVTIASSVAVEARCFDRPTRVLNPLVLDRNSDSLTTLNGFRCSGFWREALKGCNLTEIAFDEPFVPNRLRSGLGFYSLDRGVYAMPPGSGET